MIKEKFIQVYKVSPSYVGFTPGRVNLIGEHTDYNGGMVLPKAISLGLTIGFRPREDKIINIHSDKFDNIKRRQLSDVASGEWQDCAVGAVVYANKLGLLTGGADIVVESNLPVGAGLSSSAAMIVSTLKAVKAVHDADISAKDIALLARRVENEYVGVPCGIMDQMAVSFAKPGQALALDTVTLDYKVIDLPEGYHMAVIHSGCFRQLSESRYRERKEECDMACELLDQNQLCLIGDEKHPLLATLPDPIRRRAMHCMTEHRRTMDAAEALESRQMSRFGTLMNQSHASMRDDFEISLDPIDALVEDAISLGALGARLTGGGFGGCIVCCVEKARLDQWKDDLLAKHEAAFFVC